MGEFLDACHYSSKITTSQGDMPRKRHIDLETAPQTIQDSFALLRAVGERDISIDSFCIDQFDAEDLHANISPMNVVYENAYIAVVAANGVDVDAGLSRLAGKRMTEEKPITVHRVDSGSSVSILPTRKSLRKTLQETRWGSRAWSKFLAYNQPLRHCCDYDRMSKTYMGIMLNLEQHFRNVAYLGDVLFSLMTKFYLIVRTLKNASRTSSYPPVRAPNLQKRKKEKKMPSKRRLNFYDVLSAGQDLHTSDYVDAVQQYSRRKLTYPGDRLDAFTGVLEKFYTHAISTSLTKKP